MLSDLNEKYLLKFISSADFAADENCPLIKLLCNFGIKLEFREESPVYDIINKMEYCGIFYE